MPKRSAGLVVYQADDDAVRVLLVHPGGPLWARRDAGAWSIPKGEYAEGDNPLEVAYREFSEELGQPAPAGQALPLGQVIQSGGKRVSAWAVAGDVDVTQVTSNTFEMEWPRGSGRTRRFPEVDRAEWFSLPVAREKILKGQAPLLDRLTDALG